MNDLRLLLLLTGIAILAGLYLRERLKSRPDPFGEEPETDPGDTESLTLSARAAEEDYSAALAVLRKNQPDADPRGVSLRNDGDRDDADRGGRRDENAGIIVMHVMAAPGAEYNGPDLVAAFDDLGLVFGDMGIYHHYGVGEMKTDQPLFHLANMLEPGSFEPDNMDDFRTRGLSLFMRLPPPLDAVAVFELMLNCARRLADSLGGEVLNPDRQPLTDVDVELLRARARSAS